MIYNSRKEAGKLLGFHLKSNLGKIDPQKTVALGLVRGGIVVAKEISRELECELDVMLVEKIGHPDNPEYAAAAVTEHEIFLNPDSHLSAEYIEREAAAERKQIVDRMKLYRAAKAEVALKDKIVILADDGIATGLSMRCAIAQVKSQHPAKVYIAVPVGAADSIKTLAIDADRVFCLYTPLFFAAVGQFYKDFTQVSDDDVVKILKGFV